MKRLSRRCANLLIYPLLLVSFSPWVFAEDDWVYTIRPGDTLWRISNEYLISSEYWPKVQQHNAIDEVFELVPGRQLNIPQQWLKAAAVPQAQARVIALKGDVQRVRGGKTTALAIDNILLVGESIRTGASASVSIEFADGSSLFMLPKSEILLEKPDVLALGKGVSIHLFRGRVETKVAPQKENYRYQITTPAAVAAVRGTRFRVAIENEGDAMRSEVLAGRVAVIGSGVERDVRANFGTFAEVGVAPLPPTLLPDAPNLSTFIKKRLPGDTLIQWQPVQGVVTYRTQLLEDDGPISLLAEQWVSDTNVTWSSLAPGDYTMRVRSQNEQGFEGADVSYTFVIKTPLNTPRVTAPADGVVFSAGRQPFFSWSRTAEANTYLLQWARDEAFLQGVEEIPSLVNTHYQAYKPLAEGQYYWRLMGQAADGRQSDFSPIRRFTISE